MTSLPIGEIARRAGVSAATLRHYERKGLLRPAARTESGYRQFPKDALERLHMIQCALAVGFTIDELSRVLRKRDAGEAPCRRGALAGAEETRGAHAPEKRTRPALPFAEIHIAAMGSSAGRNSARQAGGIASIAFDALGLARRNEVSAHAP
jgi:DNA-binding transcriptional MerR regulator